MMNFAFKMMNVASIMVNVLLNMQSHWAPSSARYSCSSSPTQVRFTVDSWADFLPFSTVRELCFQLYLVGLWRAGGHCYCCSQGSWRGSVCSELQSKHHNLGFELSIENAEITENCPWKMMIFVWNMSNYCCESRYGPHQQWRCHNRSQRDTWNDPWWY